MAQSIVNEGLKNVAAGANPMDLKRGIDKAVKAVVEGLKCQSFNLSAFTVLFSACAGVSTMFMYTVLKYFSTDGFRGM